MSYAAMLRGQRPVIESIAPCFTSSEARIRVLDKHWILESSRFSNCSSIDEAFRIADRLVIQIQGVLGVYLGLHSSISVSSILTLDPNGRAVHQRLRELIVINVYSAHGLRELSDLSKSKPMGSALLALSAYDSAVEEALKLVGERGLGWSQIYDIIEFLGGENAISSSGFSTRSQTRLVRRTANYYRHLGRKARDPLPTNPPTLAEAQIFAAGLLKRWLGARLSAIR